MKLEELLGEELYKQVQEKLDEVNGKEPDKLKHVRYADLSEGGYIAKDKYDSKVTELSGVKKQLDDANAAIKSYQDMDVDGIKQSAKDWEEKYKADTKALKEQMETQERSHQTDMFLAGYHFSSKAAQAGIRMEFEKKQFKLENGEFLGAKDYMKSLMENDDYKGAFVVENPDSNPENGDNAGDLPESQNMYNLPQFAAATNGGNAGGSAGHQNAFMNFGFTHVRPVPTETK